MGSESRGVVFFDVGGTLVDVSPSVGAVYATACAARGARVAPSDLQEAFDRAWVTLSEDVPRGADRYRLFAGGEREWWERVSTRAFDLCGVPVPARPPADELRAVFARPEAWKIYPEARDALAELRRRGYRLGVLSNWDSRLPELLAALDLEAHFEALIYSAAAGYEKPHPAIFTAALEALNVDPSRAVHIGDRLEEDYAGAKSAGMRALLVRRGPDLAAMRQEMTHRGDERDLVADLGEAVRRIVE
ncbi:MAG TPA: HAD-IA family hydrolase [Patescibacteria group bacterium]|nr:HAD-IA family hydrolase [Patescibacteria group bacterium]